MKDLALVGIMLVLQVTTAAVLLSQESAERRDLYARIREERELKELWEMKAHQAVMIADDLVHQCGPLKVEAR